MEPLISCCPYPKFRILLTHFSAYCVVFSGVVTFINYKSYRNSVKLIYFARLDNFITNTKVSQRYFIILSYKV